MGRHGGPGSDEESSVGQRPAGGRRRAPETTETPRQEPRPDDDEPTTLGRRTRAERRREGSLPPGEDPLSGRPVRGTRPTPAPPGRAAGPGEDGRPPAQTGPRTSVAPQPVPPRTPHQVPRDGAPPPVSGPRTTSDPLTTTRPPVSRTPPLQNPSTTDLPVVVGPPTPPSRRLPGATATGETPTTSRVDHDRAPAIPPAAAPSVPPRRTVEPPPTGPAAGAPVRDPDPEPDPGHGSVGGSRTAPTAAQGPATGPQGGRAALRAERQAADAARRREDRRRGVPPVPAPVEEDPRRGSRALVFGLVSVVVVALVLLSVWSFSRTDTDEAAQTQSAAPTTAVSTQAPPSTAPSTTVPPADPPAAPAPTGPVFAPVSVLNSAGISGLAAAIGDQLVAGGWEIRTLGTYGSDDVATTTVYYTEGDTVQQQAAESLVAQFPEVSGPAVRFFEIPDLPDPGIVVIADGSWRP